MGKETKKDLYTKDKEVDQMAVLAKPSNRITQINADSTKKFLKEFNNNKPTDEFLKTCRSASELFKRGK